MNKVSKLITAGDGFCLNHHWPMWSGILAKILDCEWKNLSTFGAGNEAIANLVLDLLETNSDLTDSLWIIQWTSPHRLDLLLNNNNQFIDIINTDKVYYDNFITTEKNKKYWCSSASELDFVRNHNKLISIRQSESRSRIYQYAVAQALTQKGVSWKFIFTYEAPWSKNNNLDYNNVIDMPLEKFRFQSQYKNLDVGEIQPVSSIHLEFLERYILPGLSIDMKKFDFVKEQVISADTHRKYDVTPT
jgi:hypothetical protein